MYYLSRIFWNFGIVNKMKEYDAIWKLTSAKDNKGIDV